MAPNLTISERLAHIIWIKICLLLFNTLILTNCVYMLVDPEGPPQDVTLEAMSSQSIKVTWKVHNCFHPISSSGSQMQIIYASFFPIRLLRNTSKTAWSEATRCATGSTRWTEATSSSAWAWRARAKRRRSHWTTWRSSRSMRWWYRRATALDRDLHPAKCELPPWRTVGHAEISVYIYAKWLTHSVVKL